MSKIKKVTHSSEEASSTSGTSSSLSSDEEIDARDLKPIKDYLSDRKELARQLFKSVKAEKIRMMLPQTLKKINLEELEEWCSSELSGMSKSRILCVLNGKSMLESSNTSESDDSGPSLEIISDTEEWFTDDDISKKDEYSDSSKLKLKKDSVKLKGKLQSHKKNDTKFSDKKGFNNKQKDVQIKKEDEKETNKEKEGDSLLDLLELEMRARAIRALIRKEEDIIPTSSVSKSKTSEPLNVKNVTKPTHDEFKAKENCRRQLERIISAQRSTTVDDEDVVLVVQPTPTIELLSSDSDGENHSGARINQKLQNERTIDTGKNSAYAGNGNLKTTHNAGVSENLEKNKIVQERIESQKTLDPRKHEVIKRIHSNNTDNKDILTPSIKSYGKRRKTKKKSHAKQQLKNITEQEPNTLAHDSSNLATKNTEKSKEHNMSVKHVGENVNIKKSDKNKSDNVIETKVPKEDLLSVEADNRKRKNVTSKIIADEDKSIDLDEIIDLDDYCDDMDDMESTENDKSKNKQVKIETEKRNSEGEMGSVQRSNSSETWASRYYQTDDVQNVIKESKIQSEIRKRLRERQRLSKLNKSPNRNSPSSSPIPEAACNKPEQNPMGSVNEYLALKRTAPEILGITSSKNDTDISQETKISNSQSADTCSADANSQVVTYPIEPEINVNDNSISLVTKKEEIDTSNGIKPA